MWYSGETVHFHTTGGSGARLALFMNSYMYLKPHTNQCSAIYTDLTLELPGLALPCFFQVPTEEQKEVIRTFSEEFVNNTAVGVACMEVILRVAKALSSIQEGFPLQIPQRYLLIWLVSVSAHWQAQYSRTKLPKQNVSSHGVSLGVVSYLDKSDEWDCSWSSAPFTQQCAHDDNTTSFGPSPRVTDNMIVLSWISRYEIAPLVVFFHWCSICPLSCIQKVWLRSHLAHHHADCYT